jgi:ribosome maturation factor RimP
MIPYFRTHIAICVAMAVFAVAGGAAFAQDAEIQRLIDNVKNGPSLYRTPEAANFYLSHPSSAPVFGDIGTDKSAAIKSLRAAILLGDKGYDARSAIQTLIDKFPHAEHVVALMGVQYQPGQGTFEDWIMTYMVNEKNKFVITSPLLEYNTISKCENFVTASHSEEVLQKKMSRGQIIEATANIYIILGLNAAQCALSKITGQDAGPDQRAWQQWFAATGGVVAASSAPASDAGAGSGSYDVSAAAVSQGDRLSDIIPKARYRMVLSTGDEFVGIVESMDDTSLVLDTDKGEAVKFKKVMVVEHELLEIPKKLQPKQSGSPGADAESKILTFGELLRQAPAGINLEVTLNSGSKFVGTVASIEDQTLKINVEGSVIPINASAIKQIATAPARKADTTATRKAPQPRTALDTLYLKNPKTDEYGHPLPDIVAVGDIIADNGQMVTFKTTAGTQTKYYYSQINRRIVHDTLDAFSDIERYGKALFCPQGMVLVDVPPMPGKKNQPFFKICIDRYEYPNQAGTQPRTNVPYNEAGSLCASQGKRLCTAQEWSYACGGLEGYTYPYGWQFEEDKCNADGSRTETSGLRSKCISKFGVYDMSGNVFEWVLTSDRKPAAMGGPMSKCQTVAPGGSGDAKPQTGFRCCMSN